jgi:polyadenylation factor subunit 2
MFWNVGADQSVGGMEAAHDGPVWSFDWHPLGHILVSGSNDYTTRFWTRNRPGDKMRDRFDVSRDEAEKMKLGIDESEGKMK